VPAASIDGWRARLQGAGVQARDAERFGEPTLRFADPSGLWFEIVGSDRDDRTPWTGGSLDAASAIRGLHSTTIMVRNLGPTLDLMTGLLGYKVVNEGPGRTRVAAGGDRPGHAIDISVDPAAGSAVNGSAPCTTSRWRSRPGRQLRRDAAGQPARDRSARSLLLQVDLLREPGGTLF
jgi:glyoxalase family protein